MKYRHEWKHEISYGDINHSLKLSVEKNFYFLLCNTLIAIHKVKLAADLHISNCKGGKIITTAGNWFIGEGDFSVVRHKVADHGKITDRAVTLKVIKGKTTVGNGVVQ